MQVTQTACARKPDRLASERELNEPESLARNEKKLARNRKQNLQEPFGSKLGRRCDRVFRVNQLIELLKNDSNQQRFFVCAKF